MGMRLVSYTNRHSFLRTLEPSEDVSDSISHQLNDCLIVNVHSAHKTAALGLFLFLRRERGEGREREGERERGERERERGEERGVAMRDVCFGSKSSWRQKREARLGFLRITCQHLLIHF